MISKIIEFLYLKIFINIVIHESSTIVYIEVCKKDEVLEDIEKTFETVEINEKMFQFIDSFVQKSPFFYISILDMSEVQGAIPTTKDEEISKFIDKNIINYKYYHNRWAYYTSKEEMKELQDRYKRVGLDFIFSPFIILSNFFKDKIETSIGMFILIKEDHIALCIFDNAKLIYGDYLDIEYEMDDGEDDLLLDDSIELSEEIDLDGDIDLNDVDVLDEIDDFDEIDSLDDFGDIEDLDSMDDINEFSEDEDISEKFTQEVEKKEIPQVKQESNFTGDYRIFSTVQKSVDDFYHDEKFNSQFIESVYVADSIGLSSDLKKYFEEEMFLSVYIRQINLAIEVASLAKIELSAS